MVNQIDAEIDSIVIINKILVILFQWEILNFRLDKDIVLAWADFYIVIIITIN